MHLDCRIDNVSGDGIELFLVQMAFPLWVPLCPLW
jgi:hypothetical protein